MHSTGLRPQVPTDLSAPYTAPPGGMVRPYPRTVPVYLPEVFPIPDAVEFNPSGSISSNGATTLTITFAPSISDGLLKLPGQNVGIIRGFSIFITNMLTSTDVEYTLLVNGSPAGGYGSIKMFPRASAFVGNSFDTFIRVPDGATIGVTVKQNDGAAAGSYVFGAAISGWYWPVASGQRWLTAGL